MDRRGRTIRVLAAFIGLLLVTAGTVLGTDDDFPFGPLRMYATRDAPNGTVSQAVVLAITRSGQAIDVTNTSGVPRRAEIEGQWREFGLEPARFDAVATAYVRTDGRIRGHSADVAVEIRLVRRVYELKKGRRSVTTDQVVARWVPPG